MRALALFTLIFAGCSGSGDKPTDDTAGGDADTDTDADTDADTDTDADPGPSTGLDEDPVRPPQVGENYAASSCATVPGNGALGAALAAGLLAARRH